MNFSYSRLFLVFSTTLLALSFPVRSMGQTTWTGAGSNDNWFNADNWDTGVIPDGSTFDVIVNGPLPTDVDATPSVNSLFVGPDGFITIGFSDSISFAGLAMNTLTNQGAINIDGGELLLHETVNNTATISAGNGDLLVQSEGATLTGGGTIILESQSSAEIRGVLDSVLTIENQTIEGRGSLGSNAIELINDGLIDANTDGSGNILWVNPSAGGMVNTGTMQASGGGQLNIFGDVGDAYNNTGGTIQALADSQIELRGSPEITGGLLTSEGTGLIRVPAFQNPLISEVTNTGDIAIDGVAALRVSGVIQNNGTIRTLGNGDLRTIEGGATLTGGGTVTLNANGGSLIQGVVGSILTIDDQTIDGGGSIGGFEIGLINDGLIDANIDGIGMRVNPSDIGMVNTGTMQASGGGELSLAGQSGQGGGVYDNTGGVIQALDSSIVHHELTGPQIVGGLLTSSGTGFHRIVGLLLTDVTNTGDMLIVNTLNLAGTFTNSGTIRNDNSRIHTASGDVTLTGGGTILLEDSCVIGGSPDTFLVIEDQTIEGVGRIGFGEIDLINNHGSLIHANVDGGVITIDPVGADTDIPWVTGEGTLRASNNGTLESRHRIVNNGTIEVESGGVFFCPAENGITCAEGSLLTGDGTVFAEFGGFVRRPISLEGAVAPGNSIGELDVYGSSVSFGSTAELNFELASATSYDVLHVNVLDFVLGGTLNITLLNGFAPDPSDIFTVLRTVSVQNSSGQLNNVASGSTLTTADGLGKFTVTYGSSVILSNYQPIQPLPATTVEVIRGSHVGGSATDLAASDNADYIVRRDPTLIAAVVEVEVESTTTIQNPSTLSFTVESSAFFRTNVIESVEFFDYDAGEFVEVDSRHASRFMDSSATVVGDGDLSRFVEDGTGNVKARVLYTSVVPRQRFTVSMDHAFWSID